MNIFFQISDMFRIRNLLFFFLLFALANCKRIEKTHETPDTEGKQTYQTIGSIERTSPEINKIIPEDAVIEVLAKGLEWAEGPLWISDKQWLLCSDVKKDKIHRWSEKEGFEVYLEPSGFVGDSTDSRERGSNGLTLDPYGRLTICQHGNRQVAQMDAPLDKPDVKFITLVSSYKGKRLNSPNDLVYDSKGNLYFTDPPFGLSEALLDDPKKELHYQGVFKMDRQGSVQLLTDKIDFPNGLAFSPDEKLLYISNTDGDQAGWLVCQINDDGSLGSIKQPVNVADLIGKEVGYPDGIKVDEQGNIFTAGPGGLWVFDNKFKLLGKIRPNEWVSNCTFDETFENLYITADDYLLRVKLQPRKKQKI